MNQRGSSPTVREGVQKALTERMKRGDNIKR